MEGGRAPGAPGSDSETRRGPGVAVRKLSLVEGSGGYALVAVHGLLTVVASFVMEHGLQARGLQ